MTIEEFWSLVEKVHRAAKGDMDRKCKLLDAELRKLTLKEVHSFSEHFDACFDRAYTWSLWAAAFIINGGCSDDSFSDFRSTLISMGRETFEGALADPESLADIDYDAEKSCYEGYEYVPSTVEEDLSGRGDLTRSRPHPDEPSGEPWEEDKVGELYPKLAEHYSYQG